MCSYRATSTIKPFFSVLVRSQDYNVSGIKNIEKVKIAPAPKESKFKNTKRNNGQICQCGNDDLVPIV